MAGLRYCLLLSLLALLPVSAYASALLDRLMPYRDYFSESVDSECDSRLSAVSINSPDNQSKAVCSLRPETRAALDGLLNGKPGEEVDLDNVASAIRDLLANDVPLNEVVDALPPFVRRMMPELIRPSHCQFEYNGEVLIHFDNEASGKTAVPYDEHLQLSVQCDSVRRFRVVLLGLGESRLAGQSGQMYPRSSVNVELREGLDVFPATVSLLNDGMLLSDRIFHNQGSLQAVSVLARLHARGSMTKAPEGSGVITGLSAGNRLVIYEID